MTLPSGRNTCARSLVRGPPFVEMKERLQGIARAARAFERAGVAAFHIEDQTFPKRCGHLDDKAVVPAPEFAGKLKAVRDALRDDDFVVVARTDAIAVEGFERAMERAHAYAAAGADAIFVEAPESIEQIEEIARRLKLPKLINMFHGGKTPLVDAAVLRELGYSIVIMPSDLQRAAVRSMQLTLQAIREDGHSARRAPDMISFAERDAIVDTAGLLALGDRFARG
jgi:2-methylisocitrate lyase-like PEP mutase family enzyme